jgi:hypothetical protein
MGKVFGLISIVLAAWLSVEIYQEGLNNAMGGSLSFMADGEAEPEGPRVSPQKRAGMAVEAHNAVAEERRNRMLEKLEE